MPLRIGFDLDGVFADMESELARQAERLFGPMGEPAADPPPPTSAAGGRSGDIAAETSAGDDIPPLLKMKLTARQQRRLWRHVGTIENFWETLEELEPGVIRRLAGIATDRCWEIIFLTKRPHSAGATAQVQSQRWLASKGFTLPSVFVVQQSRGRIAASLELDIVIDDQPENCLDVVVDSKARAVLVWRGDEALVPASARRLGIGVVKTVGGCLDILTQSDSPEQEPPGVLDRVMRLLGLKEPANA